MFTVARLAVVTLGDRLLAVALRRGQVEAFAVEADNPAAALRAELDTRRVPARHAALALARGAATVKPIDLPAVAGDVADMVRFELDRHLPFPAEDAPFDFLVLPAQRDGERVVGRRVVVAAADRRVVEGVLTIAHDAGLRPLSLTVAAHDLPALARVPRDRRIVWVHRAGGVADLLFLAGGTLALSRNVPGADGATLADEIRRSLAVVRWRGCDAIWVSGDAAPTSGDGALAALGAPVSEPAYTSRARAGLDALPTEERGAWALALAVALGRGIRPLDLLPRGLRPRRLTRPQAVTLAMAGVTALLLVAVVLVPGYREQRYLARLDAEIRRLDPEVRAAERVLGELERKRKLLATIDSLERSGIRPLPILRELTELLPQDAWVTTLSIDGKGVELTGQAAAAAALIPVLENSPRFERVEFASPVTRGRDREQFRIRAAWETNPAQVAPAGGPAAPGPVRTPTAPGARPSPGAQRPAVPPTSANP